MPATAPYLQNNATERLEGLFESAADLPQAYRYAREIARIQCDVDARRGHRLIWGRADAFRCALLPAAEESFAVVGRHTRCEVVLRHDPFVALRHVLVRSVPLPTGGVGLRVLDLHTGLGFVLPDGSRHSSIFAEGPIAIGIGDYALVALPTESHADRLPSEMPPPVVETATASRPQLHALSNVASPYRGNMRPPGRLSRVVLMPSPFLVGELGLLTSAFGAEPPALRPGRPPLANYAITLSRAGRSATVALTEEDLGRGVLIGRSNKCHAELLRQITSEKTSRAHVLLLREGTVVSAYDLASTQGTYQYSLPSRRVVLSDRGASMTLGRGSHAVQLRWHPRA